MVHFSYKSRQASSSRIGSLTMIVKPFRLLGIWRLLNTIIPTDWKRNTCVGQTILLHFKTPLWNKKSKQGTSLVVQWLRIHLPMQGTQVQSLVWEDPWFGRIPHVTGQLSPWMTTTESFTPTALLWNEKPVKQEAHVLQIEKACTLQQRLSTAKNVKLIN